VIFGTAVADREVTLMRYKPKSNAALSVALGGLPEQMRVEVDADIGVSASTVGQLRQKPVWPDNLVITTPQEVYAESVVRVSRSATPRASRRNREENPPRTSAVRREQAQLRFCW
jgi:hypothetical protein